MKKNIKELSLHEKDTGSSEVQIGLLTDKIETLSKHVKQYKKDKHSSVGLLKAVNKRKKLLDYLKKNKIESYKNISADSNHDSITIATDIDNLYSVVDTVIFCNGDKNYDTSNLPNDVKVVDPWRTI